MSDELAEALGRLVDHCDGALGATKLPLPAEIHVAGLTGAVEHARAELVALLIAAGKYEDE